MKSFTTLLIILALCSFGYGRVDYLHYKTINLKDKSDKFSFPVFTNSSNNYTTEKINQLLQISELEILKGFETANIFEVVKIDDGRIYGGKVGIAFQVKANNSKVLSVKFDQSSCGATCVYWVRYYNFNSGNGDLIQLKDLFTENGFERFFTFLTNRRIAQLKAEIRKLPATERDGFEGISGSYEADDLTDFYIKGNTLFIDGENSFSKNQKFSGVETVCQFRLSEFRSYLNNYGKSLFGLNGSAIKRFRSRLLPQLFHGKIGDQNVLLILNKGYEDEMKAEYVYSKYGKGIYLEGKIKGNELSLIEKLPKPKENGFIDYVDNGIIRAKFEGQIITGTWISQDGTKIYDLLLSRK
jgi:hypothetical protein